MVSYHTFAQDIFAWQKIDFNGTPRYHMYKYDFFQGNQELLFSITQQRFLDLNKAFLSFDEIHSFEYSLDRRYVYFMQYEGALFRYEVSTDSLIFLLDLTPETIPFILVHGYTQINSIDFISDSILYTSGFTYSEYNINTNTYKRIRQPISNPVAFTPREQDILVGRLVKHKGKYIYFSRNTDKLMLLDMVNPDNNSTILDLGQLFSPSFRSRNLVSIQYGCDSTNLYFLGTPKQIDNTIPIGWYKLDAETGALQFSHFEPLNITERVNVFHKHYNATTWESCQRFIDLDVDDSTAEGIDFRVDSLCSYDAAPLSDLDIKIRNEYPIDSLVITVVSPTSLSNINISSGNYTTTSSGNTWRIINNGSTSITDYMDAIKNAYLNNTTKVNEITLQFTVWYDSIGGNPAIATLVFPVSLPYAGLDTIRSYCEGDTSLVIKMLAGTNADLDGTYYDADFNQIIDIDQLKAPFDGVIYYETTNGICYDTAQINLSINPLPTVIEKDDVSICFDGEYTVDISLENNESLTWSDGLTDRVRNISAAGIYSYQITNQYDCATSDTFTITKLPQAASMATNAQICDGQNYTYMDKTYVIPGTFTDTISSKLGCDSVFFTLNLAFYPDVPIDVAGDFDFCEGSNTEVTIISPHDQLMLDDIPISNPISFAESGDYILSATDQYGCPQEKEMTINIYPIPEVSAIDMIDTVFVAGLKLPVTYDGEIDRYLWSPSSSLDCGDCPFPTLLSASEGTYTIAIEDKNGCKNEAKLSITFLDTKLYLPNVISNQASDPENSIFYLKGNNSTNYTLAIYDRWGNLMFIKNNAVVNNREDGWQPKGKVASGVYIYLISYIENEVEKTLYGDITVLD